MSGLFLDLPASTEAAKSAEAGRAPDPIAKIDTVGVNIGKQVDLVHLVTFDALTGRGGTVFTLNLDHLVKLEHDPAFRAAYDQATYVSADGAPVVAMARRQGANLVRVTGADLVRPLCGAAALARVPVHFFGTSPETLATSVAVLRCEFPRLIVADFESPPYGFSPFGVDARAAAERIAPTAAPAAPAPAASTEDAAAALDSMNAEAPLVEIPEASAAPAVVVPAAAPEAPAAPAVVVPAAAAPEAPAAPAAAAPEAPAAPAAAAPEAPAAK